MLKKLSIVGACALLALIASTESQAAHSAGYYYIVSCSILNPRDCPVGPAPIWYGPFTTLAECNTKLIGYLQSPLNHPPYAASNCFNWPGG